MQSPAVSIFNDVLGPIMTGPSSSHTAGPWRIGYFIHHLMPQFSAVRILFPQKGSYAGVYKGQKSDIALVAGLLGMEVLERFPQPDGTENVFLDGGSVILVGYDQNYVTYVDVASGNRTAVSLEQMDAMLAGSGRTFISALE